jgi:hypothetical protein
MEQHDGHVMTGASSNALSGNHLIYGDMREQNWHCRLRP